MKKIILYTLLGLLVIVLGVIVINYFSNPLRKSEERIRENILGITPIGMSMEDVIKVIEDGEQWDKNHKNYEWVGKYRYYDYGFSIKNGRIVMRHHGYRYNDVEMIGKETLEAVIGQYRNFFEVTVFAYWAFDEDDRLVDVGILKGSSSF